MEKSNNEVSPENNAPKASPKTAKKSVKNKGAKIKAKLLNTYYGHPLKDMKLICITGTAGKVEVAHFVYEILKAAGHPVELLASENNIKLGTLHKFLSQSWKAGANYVVVTAPAESLKNNVFYGLPVYVAAMTDFLPASLDAMSPEEYSASESTLFKMNPDVVVLNEDDTNFSQFSRFVGHTDTLTYGTTRSATLRIDGAKLYKKGTEASLSLGSSRFSVASFLTGEPIVSYMACAAAVATSLHIANDVIADGIANYNPDHVE